ncbi:LOW QUALITY PROTEIN: hypothetical protein PHMEG_00011604 [Phytophthora megakarya]|uniref:Reverse transcriptase zinc-binding domain-containing protein n=1 Tax=Phytophthora megakarya TaxID=4795 RepID=A0A225WB48_9STRA|nr:LOW QUALITY PROTEIN: hypothetical protein PHMEG_00011604 [Phytophthora megakarya]
MTQQQWASLQASFGSVNRKEHVPEMQFWNNICLLLGKLSRPLCDLHPRKWGLSWNWVVTGSRTLSPSLAVMLLQSFSRFFWIPTSLQVQLHLQGLSTLSWRSATQFYQPPSHVLTFLAWRKLHRFFMNGVLVDKPAYRNFVKLLKPSEPPDLPLEQLHLSNFTLQENTWTQEYMWDRHGLPVCADLTFMLQYNALAARYKFTYRVRGATSAVCIHDCKFRETAIHLFWYCPVARYQWEYYLSPFDDLNRVRMGDGTFPSYTHYHTNAMARFGLLALQVGFSIVRCCVFGSLWLHRNKRLYNPAAATSAPWVRRHAYAYVKLHLHKYCEHLECKGAKTALGLVAYVSDALWMDLQFMNMTNTLTMDGLQANGTDGTQA